LLKNYYKKAQVVVDDNLQKLGLKTVTKPTDISLKTFKDVPDHESRFSVDMPGEYETAGLLFTELLQGPYG
jgi:hypothetical protein